MELNMESLPLIGCLAAGITTAVIVGYSIMKEYNPEDDSSMVEAMESLEKEMRSIFSVESVEREGNLIVVYLKYFPNGNEHWSMIPISYRGYDVETRIRGESEKEIYKIK